MRPAIGVSCVILALALAGLTGPAHADPQPVATPIKGFTVDTDGKLGVGTTQPGAQLEVVGDVIIRGDLNVRGAIKGPPNSVAIGGINGAGDPMLFTFLANPPQIQIRAFNPAKLSDPPVFKTFIIGHPQAPDRYLVHAAIEGPEGAVYYRGSAQLRGGKAQVALPAYFEALTRKEGRTVQLTNVDGFDVLAVQTRNGAKVADGAFLVVSRNPRSSQRFDWEVKAVRADAPQLAVEPLRRDITIGGFGPYTYEAPAPEGDPR